jgi:hypothetical protein
VSDLATEPLNAADAEPAGRPRKPGAGTPRDGVTRFLRAISVPAAVAAAVALLAQLPLVRNRLFYFWDDSAAQFIPMYRALGERVLAGHWPTMLDPDAWMGGNIAAESLFGEWNPVNVGNYVLVASVPDLAVAAAIVKTEYLVLLAVGTYLLCREYGAARWASSVLAVALPFSGFTLYFEASSWAAGLMSFAWIPLLWWAIRRYLNGRTLAVWPFVVGFLTITSGNPYGLLAVGVVVFGLAVELLLTKRKIWQLAAIAACLGGVALLVFLPLVGNSAVSWRENREMFNNGQLVPSLSDLANMSMPSHQPKIAGFDASSIRIEVPALYFAWFIMPLLPWLRWKGTGWRMLAGPLTVAGTYLLLSLGPSNFWWFRWPLRLVEYMFLGLAVVFAVVLSAGLRTDHLARRIGVTAAILAGSAYLSFASWPKVAAQHLVSVLVLSVLIGLLILVARKGSRWMVAVLQLGTAAVLALQLVWFPSNKALPSYVFPTSVAELKSNFGSRYHGNTLQVADGGVDPRYRPERDLLFGNMYRAAGVQSTTSYSGIGHRSFHKALCLTWRGMTCKDLYNRLWEPTRGATTLADMLRLETVVVQHTLIDKPIVPDGWRVAENTAVVTVLRRDDPVRWPHGRLGTISADVSADTDECSGPRSEQVRFHRLKPGPAAMVFARINWPGYRAEVNGVDLPVRDGPAGLVAVQLPDGVDAGELRLHWTPPGQRLGFAGVITGLLGALTLTGLQIRRRRRATRADQPTDAQ